MYTFVISNYKRVDEFHEIKYLNMDIQFIHRMSKELAHFGTKTFLRTKVDKIESRILEHVIILEKVF